MSLIINNSVTMTSSDSQVQGSNDWSIASKLSTVNAGYYVDEFIKFFALKPVRRSSLIHRGYHLRAKVMDHVFQNFLTQHRNSQVISLGAGFDSAYFQLSHMGFTGFKYVEIDFPDVVKRKEQLIQKSPSCLEHSANGQYHLVSADLRDLTALGLLLFDRLKLNTSAPTLFVSECAITYMDEFNSSKLIEWCAATFQNSVFAVYEQIHPEDGFGQVMQAHFNLFAIPLLSLETYHNKQMQQKRYLQKGWSTCEVYSLNEFWHLIPTEERKRARHIEAFDEYEGLHWTCSHYSILTAAKGGCGPLLPPRENPEEKSVNSRKPEVSWSMIHSEIMRFGQASAAVGGFLWITGGFGGRTKCHSRLDDLKCVAVGNPAEISHRFKHTKLARMFHTIDAIKRRDGSHFLSVFGGRTHPSNPLNDVCIFHPLSDQFECHLPEESESWPLARWRHSGTAVANAADQDQQLLICGGRGVHSTYSDCWLLQFIEEEGHSGTSLRWRPFAQLPHGRHSHSATCWRDKVVVFGGLDDDEDLCRMQMLVSDIVNPRWVRPDWNGPLPMERYSHQAAVSSDQLILVGGTNRGSSPPGVCIVDLVLWNCTEYSLPAQDPRQPVILSGHSCCLQQDDSDASILKILCFGGGGPCFSFGTHLNGVCVTVELPQQHPAAPRAS